MGRAIGLIIFGTLAIILLAFTFSENSGLQRAIPGVNIVAASETESVADYIVFAGRITDSISGKWLNDYTVIPYLDGNEISQPQTRTTSRIGKFAESGEGVHDGCFILYIPNRYELTESHVFIDSDKTPVTMQYKDGGFGGRGILYIWLGDVNPGDVFRLGVPDKQIEYAVAIMPEDNANLDPEIHQISTTLGEDGRVTTQTDNPSRVEVEIPESTIQISWTREYTVQTGTTIWNSWKWYVEGQVPGMNWSTYYAEVVQRNPDLVRTGYFVPGQTYYLPFASSS